MVSIGTFVNDTLGLFGMKGGAFGYALDSLTGNQTGALKNLQDMFLETALGKGTGPLQRMMGSLGMGMMPPWATPFGMPSPMSMFPAMMPFAGAGYAGLGGAQQIDLAPGSSNVPFLSQLFSPSRRMAGQIEKMIRSNPMARAAFEAQMGGTLLPDLRNDGKMTIMRSPGMFPMGGMLGGNPFAMSGLGYLANMQQAVMGTLGGLGGLAMGGLGGLGALGMAGGLPLFGGGSLLGNPFMGLAMGGFANVLGMMGPAGGGWSPFDNSGPRGGQGFGSWNPLAMPGRINNTNPGYETAHQYEVSSVLADPSLSVEDKVTLMIMLIMKKMDKDIERQAQYINSIQQQQSNRGGGGGKGGGKMGGGGVGGIGGKGGGGGGGNSAPSIDVETMKLKRMIDKRGQMFDMLRQIIDKYNETAKGIIQSIGR